MTQSKNPGFAMVLIAALMVGTGSCEKQAEAPPGPPVYEYRIVRTYPHDPEAFTQGLIFYNGFLYEGTGGNGTSHLRRVDLTSGKVLQEISLPNHLWGEGVTLWEDQLLQLTWKGQLGYRYDRDTLHPGPRFRYDGEGWGLTHDGTRLIMSNGTHRLTFRNPNTFAVIRSLEVKEGTRPVTKLNELEYVKGRIYANVWLTTRIAIIDPQSGQVTAWIDLADLKARHPNADVLNGIAYDAQGDRLFVTGKWWSKLYEIALVENAKGQ